MTARRLLILLLVWLIPLSQVLAYPAMRAQNASHSSMNTHAQHTDQLDHAMHDCCAGDAQQDHAQGLDQQCDDGHCLSHCTFTLQALHIIKPSKINTPTNTQLTSAPASVTLKTPLRPPAFL